MQVIYKYPLKLTDDQYVQMPRGSKVLTVQVQKDVLCVWALVPKLEPEDVDLGSERRRFTIVGTGNPTNIHPGINYVGTVQMDGFVWHVFGG